MLNSYSPSDEPRAIRTPRFFLRLRRRATRYNVFLTNQSHFAKLLFTGAKANYTPAFEKIAKKQGDVGMGGCRGAAAATRRENKLNANLTVSLLR